MSNFGFQPPARYSPEVWCQMFDIIILDPDGWDRSNFDEDWAKALTREEFVKKMMVSTIQPVKYGER